MTSRIERLLLALMFAFVFASATFVIANAQDGGTTPPPANDVTYDNCTTSHGDIDESWQIGPHEHAMIDQIFSAEW